MAETLVVVSKVKAQVKNAGFRTGQDFIDGLSQRIERLVIDAIEKVKASGDRKTLGAEDL